MELFALSGMACDIALTHTKMLQMSILKWYQIILWAVYHKTKLQTATVHKPEDTAFISEGTVITTPCLLYSDSRLLVPLYSIV